jgi:hypothetical protein
VRSFDLETEEMSLDYGDDFDELKRRLQHPETWLGKPLRRFHQKATLKLQGMARENAPADRGQLGQTIATKISSDPVPLWSQVGTNAKHARPQEYGTGLLSEAPDSLHKRHFPPPDALETWARRHGMESGWQVAFAIYKRGGLRPTRFLRNAFDEGARYVKRYLREAGREIERLWGQM